MTIPRPALLLLLALAGCAAPGRETQASREYLECQFQAQYAPPDRTGAQREADMAKCRRQYGVAP